MCFPFTDDERIIFTCSISLLNEWDTQVENWLRIRTKWNQKELKLFSSTLKLICELICLFGKRTCLFRMVAPVLTEWMYLFRDNRFSRMDMPIRRTSVRKGCSHFNQTVVSIRKSCTRYNRKVSSDSYIKDRIPLQRHN